jgi:protein-L-isoaspartate(D-aspartate) O-methyltransferase
MEKINNFYSKEDTKEYKALRENMVKKQIISRGIRDKRVINALRKVPRHIFVDKAYIDSAYDDMPLPIGSGQTISQPYIVALMTESLELSGNEKVLEIGTGSGYQVAILAELAKEVYTVELITSLYKKNKELFKRYKNIKMSNHDGYLGWEEYAPYDRIIITAAPGYIPDTFTEQLKDGGIMVIPVGSSSWSQILYKIIKKGNNIKKIRLCNVAFVPLTRSLNKWQN